MKTIVSAANGTLAAVQDFLRQLLEAGVVDALLVPIETPAGTVAPALITDPGVLEQADPLAPVMGMNAARAVAWCSAPGAGSPAGSGGRIGAVLRPCELRALVELAKLQQTNLDSVVTIGVDCLGTYDVPVYATMRSNGGVDMTELLATAAEGDLRPQGEYAFRDACQMCERPHVEQADIVLELFGADLKSGVPITLPDEMAEKLWAGAGPTPAEQNGRRDRVVDTVVAARTKVRDERFAAMRERLDQETVEGVLAACVRCHNCMEICPICYCKTCLFKSSTFDHEPVKYMDWARYKGLYRLPADTMLFHLTRLNHMGLSCVGCGMCSSGCMAHLPVGLVFRVIGQQVQAKFDYVPGRSADEPLPMITFNEEEWTEAGGE